MSDTVKPTALDLFSGGGGLSLGLCAGGFEVLGAVDSWDKAVISYRKNFSHPVVEADLGRMERNDFIEAFGSRALNLDLLAGGPPCQGFSIQRIGPDADVRNNLVLEFGRVIALLVPRAFLMENVPGLLGKRGRETASQFENVVKTAGYEVRHTKVNAASYGVPQIRNRIFYFGWKLGEAPIKFPWPTHKESGYRTVWDAISDLPSPAEPDGWNNADPLHRRSRLSATNLKRLELIPPGKGFESLPVELRVKCHQNGAAKIGHRYVYGRLAEDEPAGTITAKFDSFTRGKFAHPREHRNITLREGARLQTFPDTFHFEGTREEIAALIGNAIPPRLATVIAHSFAEHLSPQSQSAVPNIPSFSCSAG